jgi:serine/threonine protein kinase
MLHGSYGTVILYKNDSIARKRIPFLNGSHVITSNVIDATTSAHLQDHPVEGKGEGVVRIHNVQVGDDGAARVTMELGRMSLLQYMFGLEVQPQLSSAAAKVRRLRVVRQVLECVVRGLHSLHGHGIVHGDVKPENIIVTKLDAHNIEVKLVDFGSSQLCGAGAPGRCTHLYAAPEMFARGAACDGAEFDAYSLGSVLYLYVHGFHVFKERNPTADVIRDRHMAGGALDHVLQMAASPTPPEGWNDPSSVDMSYSMCCHIMIGLLEPKAADRMTIDQVIYTLQFHHPPNAAVIS